MVDQIYFSSALTLFRSSAILSPRLSSNQNLEAMPGERVAASDCYGRFSRFELYSIRFEHLAEERKGLTSIELFGTRFSTLYKRRDGDGDGETEIPVGEMLYFASPRRLSDPTCDPIQITFGDPDWGWAECFDDREELGSFNTIKTKRVVDRDTDSCAVITYEFIRHCIEAEPIFVVEDPQQRGIKIKITNCNIFAFTNENTSTKRLLKHVGPKKSAAACGKGKPVVLDSGDQIKLDRPVLAIPFRGELQLLVYLTYSFSHEGKEEEGVTIKEICSTKAPIKPKIASTVFSSTTPGGLDLKLDLSWYDSDLLDDEDWDFMDNQDDEFWDLTDHAEENIKRKCVDLNPQQEETGDTYTAAPADAAFEESGNGHETLKTEDILHPTGDLQQLSRKMEVPNDKAARPPPTTLFHVQPGGHSSAVYGYPGGQMTPGECSQGRQSGGYPPQQTAPMSNTTPSQMTPGECSQGRQYAHGFTE